jgi:hypothetical protein
MMKPDILEQLAAKGADIRAIADGIIGDRQQIPRLAEALQSEKSSRRCAYEKAERFLRTHEPSAKEPDHRNSGEEVQKHRFRAEYSRKQTTMKRMTS